MPSSQELEKELERAVVKTAVDVTNLQNKYKNEFARVQEAVKNCESEAEAQKLLENFHDFNQRIISEMSEVTKRGQAEVIRITKEIEDQKQRERAQELKKSQEKADKVERKKREEAEREAREMERIRREKEEENRRKVEEMKERMRNDEDFVRKYIVNLRIEGFGGGVAVYNGEKIVGAAADASLGPIANARVGVVAKLTDKDDEKAIDYNLAKVGLFDDAVKARAGLNIGVKDEGPAAGSAYVKVAKVDVGDGVIGADAGVKLTGGVQDSSGRTGLIAEANLANANIGPVNASLGLSATTAFKADNSGVSAEVLGTGFSVGDNGFKIKLFGSSFGIGW